MGDKSQGELFPEDELAPPGASSESLSADGLKVEELSSPDVSSDQISDAERKLKSRYARLDGDAQKQAKEVNRAGKAHETAWDNLIPILDEMQSLLSERGKDHDRVKRAGLPSWTKWWNQFKQDNDFDACLRRVQKKLKEFRARQRAREETEPRETLHEEQAITPEERKRFKDLQRDLTEGERAGINLSEILAKFITNHFSAHEMQELVDRLQHDPARTKAPPGVSRVAPQAATDNLREMPG